LDVDSKNFPEKVIKYLWDDAVKFKRDLIFNDRDYPTLELVIEAFEGSLWMNE
jgi:5-methylcytosine-specific restriction enzyme B